MTLESEAGMSDKPTVVVQSAGGWVSAIFCVGIAVAAFWAGGVAKELTAQNTQPRPGTPYFKYGGIYEAAGRAYFVDVVGKPFIVVESRDSLGVRYHMSELKIR